MTEVEIKLPPNVGAVARYRAEQARRAEANLRRMARFRVLLFQGIVYMTLFTAGIQVGLNHCR